MSLSAGSLQGTGQGLLALTLLPEPYPTDPFLVFLSSLLLPPASPLLTLLPTPSWPAFRERAVYFTPSLFYHAYCWPLADSHRLPQVTSTLPQLQYLSKTEFLLTSLTNPVSVLLTLHFTEYSELEETHKDHQVRLSGMACTGMQPMALMLLAPCSNQLS